MRVPLRELGRRRPPNSFHDMLALRTNRGIAQFIGPPEASSFVQAKVEELKREG